MENPNRVENPQKKKVEDLLLTINQAFANALKQAGFPIPMDGTLTLSFFEGKATTKVVFADRMSHRMRLDAIGT